uniref:uncharacterized protein LOC117603916 n=1 Tax=Osmia lignaria TaxID=473952 RepID=UPI001478622F|nr:uncharacterized protein LOC117603916 [Osmia lignaria]
MDLSKCVIVLLACSAVCCASSATKDEDSFVDKGVRAMYRVYEDCQTRNIAISPCLKKKAIAFFERLGRMHILPLSENFELIRTAEVTTKSSVNELEASLGRTVTGKDEILNEILLDRVASLLNSFNIQIRLPKTTPGELKRGMEEGRGKMKKMMGMMMMGFAMKMMMIPLALGVLFLLAGKALIVSKIALVLSLIIGLKKLLSQKQGHDHGGWQQGGGGWDRSLKILPVSTTTQASRDYAHNLAYSARHQH